MQELKCTYQCIGLTEYDFMMIELNIFYPKTDMLLS